MGFTAEQLKAIYLNGRNLLVSAAAGSGKTAVLVERIIQMVKNEENPIDIDSLLVVTFTSAAASEMRERIGDALEAEIEKNPHSNHLQRQLVLLGCSNIMTVHSFCMKVIKGYYHRIHLDPGFRIGDENELELMKKDVLEDLLEKKYEQGEEAFLNFIESYAGQKSDEAIETLILNAHRFSVSNPWPLDWLTEQADRLRIESMEDLEQKDFYIQLKESVARKLEEALTALKSAETICNLPEGPTQYLDSIMEYTSQINKLQECLKKCYREVKAAFDAFQSIRLSGKRTGFDPQLKELAKEKIDAVKELVSNLKEQYFFSNEADVLSDLKGTAKSIETLIKLTVDFTEEYQLAKEERSIIDFNDIEHFALKILVEKNEEGRYVPSSVAKIFQNYFHEILVDEYQDSNLVQETILGAISKEELGQPNIFMVGDLKQSIYKFRLARPELFLSKYHAYSVEDSPYQRIDLHKNFRSRREVTSSINFIFEQLMSERLGDMEYNESAALHVGASYEECPESHFETELLLVHSEKEEEEETELSGEEEDNLKASEARVVARRIQEMVHGAQPLMVYDKKTSKNRKVEYKDIAILLRTTSRLAEEYLGILHEEGIPAYYETKTGYFETLEIQLILSLLQVIDNPRQDIPLAAVLHSPIVGLSGDDLAYIRSQKKAGELLEAVKLVLERDSGSSISSKLERFFRQLKEFREVSTYMPMDELIGFIYEQTGYDLTMSLLPGGQRRRANLDMLMDRAAAYEKSSYRGLFNFIRYIENIKKMDMDLGEASTVNENDQLVRIMSIHKSKGLEFPVVFVAGIEKRFNLQDLNQLIVFHEDLGIASDYVDFVNRYRVGTLHKAYIREKLREELMSEELRILYVALTRAREKLILVGGIKSVDSILKKWQGVLLSKQTALSSGLLQGANSMLDWMICALLRHQGAQLFRERLGFSSDLGTVLQTDCELKIVLQSKPSTNYEEEVQEDSFTKTIEQWSQISGITNSTVDEKLNWIYPNEAIMNTKVQMSVTDIKKLQTEDHEELPDLPEVPEFIAKKEGLTGAERGTLYHKVMTHLPIKTALTLEEIESFLVILVGKNIITESDRKYLEPGVFLKFLRSPIAKRMETAKSLQREKPFVLGIPVGEMLQIEHNGDDIVMIQGVIDAFFEEDNELVLVDYKTDRVFPGQEGLLEKRYGEQLMYYRRALEQITGKKVRESLIIPLMMPDSK